MKQLGKLAPILALICLGACTGLSSSNVGEPSGYRQRQFMSSLDRVHPGMSRDSLDLLFADTETPGDAGVIKRSRLVTDDFERITYTLGWLSNPKHQIGTKDLDEMNVAVATVIVEDDSVRYVQRVD